VNRRLQGREQLVHLVSGYQRSLGRCALPSFHEPLALLEQLLAPNRRMNVQGEQLLKVGIGHRSSSIRQRLDEEGSWRYGHCMGAVPRPFGYTARNWPIGSTQSRHKSTATSNDVTIRKFCFGLLVSALSLVVGRPITTVAQESQWSDLSSHRVLSVATAPDVNLEVLDWGGGGRPVVLLAGLGNTAHIFDDFAPKLAQTFHVYGITRRGYGLSSVPPSGYSTDRLAEDDLAVIDALRIAKPIVMGHSIAGEELTALGTQYPTRVAALIYLEAAYDRTAAAFAQWNALAATARPPPPASEDMQSYSALRSWYMRTAGSEPPEADLRATSIPSPLSAIGVPRTPRFVSSAILAGLRKPDYGAVRVPALAIYALPRSVKDLPGYNIAAEPALRGLLQLQREQVRSNGAAFRAGVHSSQVIEIRGAKHYLFLTDEAEVLRDVRRFIANVP
jgi:pimeloyl-ACP methyl ester carboxylesterase